MTRARARNREPARHAGAGFTFPTLARNQLQAMQVAARLLALLRYRQTLD